MKSLTTFLSVFFTATPFFYLASCYGDLPDRIPIHFDLFGNPDGYGPKWILWLLLGLLIPLVVAVTARWRLDTDAEGRPTKLARMGLVTLATTSLLFTYLIYLTTTGGGTGVGGLVIITGVVFATTGNYFPVLPRNRWVGFRIPKTLRSDRVWRAVHRAVAPYFAGGGLVLIAAGVLLPVPYVSYALIAVIVLTLGVGLYVAWRTPETDDPGDFV